LDISKQELSLAGTALARNGSANAGELFPNAPSDKIEGKSLSSVAGGSFGRGPFRVLVDTVSDTLYDKVAREKPSYAGGCDRGKTSAELKISPEAGRRRVVVCGGGEGSESWDEELKKEEKQEALTNSHEELALSQMTSSTKKAIVLSKRTRKRRSAQGYVCDE
jgi:hypothetical protein